ncbi:MAG: hypothetical protein AAFN77_11245 [Planctomycetota bacterium]
MEPPKSEIAFTCQCGKTYQVNAKLSGQEILCAQCNQKIRFPGKPQPPDFDKPKASQARWTYLISAIGFLLAAASVFVVGLFAWQGGIADRRIWLWGIMAPVLLLMGIGSLIKFIFGSWIEWD